MQCSHEIWIARCHSGGFSTGGLTLRAREKRLNARTPNNEIAKLHYREERDRDVTQQDENVDPAVVDWKVLHENTRTDIALGTGRSIYVATACLTRRISPVSSGVALWPRRSTGLHFDSSSASLSLSLSLSLSGFLPEPLLSQPNDDDSFTPGLVIPWGG